MLWSTHISMSLCLLHGAVLLSAQTPKYKAVWEPRNVKADVSLLDVYFVTDDIGWVAGGVSSMAGGVILNTRDGGMNWTVQAGDTQSSDRAIDAFRFMDATHGWAVQSGSPMNRLLRTDDGETWTPVGSIQTHYTDYTFTSVLHGIVAGPTGENGVLELTDDGGNTWKRVATCEAETEVGGLTKRIGCDFLSLSFPVPATGYAVGSSSGLPNGFVLFKTTDGGVSWQHSVVKTEEGRAENVFFVDEKTGYVRIGYPDRGILYRTTDGGQTWTRTAASPGKSIHFADPEVGWAFHYNKLSYTVGGGKMWTSRTFAFPVSVNAFSLPNRHRAYVAGDHGMVYRYSVVPANYVGKGMIDAPMMPGYGLPVKRGN